MNLLPSRSSSYTVNLGFPPAFSYILLHSLYPVQLQAIQGLLLRNIPMHDDATTMLHDGYGVFVVMCSVSNIAFSLMAKKCWSHQTKESSYSLPWSLPRTFGWTLVQI